MITQPLREEHRELLPEVAEVVALADLVETFRAEEVRAGLIRVERFLHHHLIPHALTEDRVLYREIEKVLGAEGATATMSRDHEEVGALAAELSELGSAIDGETISADQAKRLRRVLYGLDAIVRLHFAKEEEVYLPLLDERLSEAEGRALFSSMERTAAQIKAQLEAQTTEVRSE